MHLEDLIGKVEEVSALYARNHGIERDATWFLLKLHEEIGELTQAFLMKTGQARAKGQTPSELDDNFRLELAGVLCQALLSARHHGIDVEAAVADKWLVWHPR